MKEIYKFIVSDYHRYYGGDERMGEAVRKL